MPPPHVEGYPDAVVRPRTAAQAFDLRRLPAGPEVADWVDYFWYVGWDRSEPHRQQVVPHPHVHLAVEQGRVLVHGISRSPFFRVLAGTGHTLGASFHAGAFHGLLHSSVGALRGRAIPAGELLGVDDRPVAAAVLASREPGEMAAALQSYVLALGPERDPVAEQARALVALAESERSVTRAEQLAERAGMSLRSLQRLFTGYVGAGPKWVIQRFRILEVAAAAHADGPVHWAALAAELGFSDQAHLVRAFSQVVGTPPAAYARDL